MSDSTFKTANELVVPSVTSATGFSISHSEWTKIKNKVSSLQKKPSFWSRIGFKDFGILVIGIGLTIIITNALLGYTQSVKTLAYIIGGFLTLIGFLLMVFDWRFHSQGNSIKKSEIEIILEIMNLIEENRSSIGSI